MLPRLVTFTAAALGFGANLSLLTRADVPTIATVRFPSAPYPLPDSIIPHPMSLPLNQFIRLPDKILVQQNWVAQLVVRNAQTGCQARLRTCCTNCNGGCTPYPSDDVIVSSPSPSVVQVHIRGDIDVPPVRYLLLTPECGQARLQSVLLTPKSIPVATLPQLPIPTFVAQDRGLRIGTGVMMQLPTWPQHPRVRMQVVIQAPNERCRAGLWRQGNRYNNHFHGTFVTVENRKIFLQIAGGHNGPPIELYLSHACRPSYIVRVVTILVGIPRFRQPANAFRSHVIPNDGENDDNE